MLPGPEQGSGRDRTIRDNKTWLYLKWIILVQYMKGTTSRKLQMEYKEINKEFWGRHLWARGYFVASSGNVTDEIIQEYIKNQDLEERKKSDNFEVGQL